MFSSPLSRSYAFFAEPQEFGCDTCPANLVLITNDPDLAHAIDTVDQPRRVRALRAQRAVPLASLAAGEPAERRALGPVLLTGATVLALLEIGLIAELSGHATIAEIGYYATQAAILPLPYAFLASLARSRLSRGDAVSELVARLARASGQEEIHAALVRALGDPSLRSPSGCRSSRPTRMSRAEPVELPDGNGRRATTLIGRNGEPVAALLHDASLREEAGLLEAVSGAAAIALENVRLNVELRARLDELKGSRARIVEAGDTERRRLERNLHDGAQQRLVGVALQLRLLQGYIRDDPDVGRAAGDDGERASSPSRSASCASSRAACIRPCSSMVSARR